MPSSLNEFARARPVAPGSNQQVRFARIMIDSTFISRFTRRGITTAARREDQQMRLRPSSTSIPLGLVCAGVALSLAALTGSVSASDRRADYVRSLTDQEVVELIEGRRLDDRDPLYCEKARDVCLAALCGSLDGVKTTRACWQQCTDALYTRCKGG